MIRSAAIPLAFASLAGCAQQPASAPATAASGARDCFSARSVNGFTARDDDTVDVQVGARRYYRLELAGVCPNVNWATGVALVSRGGTSFICQGLDADLVVPNPGLGPQRCLVSSVRRLSDAEVQALRRR
jgi:hypothetical protein